MTLPSFEQLTQHFVCVVTVWARNNKLSTVKAIVHLRVVFVTLGTSNVTSITSPSKGKETQQTVVEKTAPSGRSICSWHFTLSVASSYMIYQTLTDIVLGSLKVSRQSEHSRYYLRSCSRDSIIWRPLPSEACEAQLHQDEILVCEKMVAYGLRWTSKLEVIIGLSV